EDRAWCSLRLLVFAERVSLCRNQTPDPRAQWERERTLLRSGMRRTRRDLATSAEPESFARGSPRRPPAPPCLARRAARPGAWSPPPGPVLARRALRLGPTPAIHAGPRRRESAWRD